MRFENGAQHGQLRSAACGARTCRALIRRSLYPDSMAPRHRKSPGRLAEIRLLENAHGFLQAIDFLLATCRPLLPRHPGFDAHGLELLELVQRVLENFLLSSEVCVCLAHVKRRLRLLPLLRYLE